MTADTPMRVLRIAEVCARVGLGETCLRKLMAQGQFPTHFKLGVRAVGFLESDIDQWIAARAARRSHTTKKEK
jgi:prophage regulatory protein